MGQIKTVSVFPRLESGSLAIVLRVIDQRENSLLSDHSFVKLNLFCFSQLKFLNKWSVYV